MAQPSLTRTLEDLLPGHTHIDHGPERNRIHFPPDGPQEPDWTNKSAWKATWSTPAAIWHVTTLTNSTDGLCTVFIDTGPDDRELGWTLDRASPGDVVAFLRHAGGLMHPPNAEPVAADVPARDDSKTFAEQVGPFLPEHATVTARVDKPEAMLLMVHGGKPAKRTDVEVFTAHWTTRQGKWSVELGADGVLVRGPGGRWMNPIDPRAVVAFLRGVNAVDGPDHRQAATAPAAGPEPGRPEIRVSRQTCDWASVIGRAQMEGSTPRQTARRLAVHAVDDLAEQWTPIIENAQAERLTPYGIARNILIRINANA